MTEKKKIPVVLFIVEGLSDEITLMSWIQGELHKIKLKAEVKIIHGDVLTKLVCGSYETIPNNANSIIEKKILEFLKGIDNNDFVEYTDIARVYYVTDSDNCFFEKERHHINKRECLKNLFSRKTIKIKNPNPPRESKKKKFSKTKQNDKKHRDASFKVIFMAEDLEVVIHRNKVTGNTKKEIDDEKKRLALNFNKDIKSGKVDFVESFSSKNENLKVWDTYDEGYKKIQNYKERATNMNVLIKEIQSGFSESEE